MSSTGHGRSLMYVARLETSSCLREADADVYPVFTDRMLALRSTFFCLRIPSQTKRSLHLHLIPSQCPDSCRPYLSGFPVCSVLVNLVVGKLSRYSYTIRVVDYLFIQALVRSAVDEQLLRSRSGARRCEQGKEIEACAEPRTLHSHAGQNCQRRT